MILRKNKVGDWIDVVVPKLYPGAMRQAFDRTQHLHSSPSRCIVPGRPGVKIYMPNVNLVSEALLNMFGEQSKFVKMVNRDYDLKFREDALEQAMKPLHQLPIEMPNFYRETVNVGDGHHMPGLKRLGPIKISGTFEDWQGPWRSGEPQLMTFQGGGQMYCRVSGITTDSYGHTTITLLPTGGPIRANKKKETPVKIRNRFYVAADRVATASEQGQDNIKKNVAFAGVDTQSRVHGKWTRKTLADAVEHAHDILENDPTKDHVAIVKIVKLVRRPKPKFIVEDVR